MCTYYVVRKGRGEGRDEREWRVSEREGEGEMGEGRRERGEGRGEMS